MSKKGAAREYIKEGIRRGKSIPEIEQDLKQEGIDEGEFSELLNSLFAYNVIKRTPLKGWIMLGTGFLVLVFLVFFGSYNLSKWVGVNEDVGVAPGFGGNQNIGNNGGRYVEEIIEEGKNNVKESEVTGGGNETSEKIEGDKKQFNYCEGIKDEKSEFNCKLYYGILNNASECEGTVPGEFNYTFLPFSDKITLSSRDYCLATLTRSSYEHYCHLMDNEVAEELCNKEVVLVR